MPKSAYKIMQLGIEVKNLDIFGNSITCFKNIIMQNKRECDT